jgi:hypothetical protein
VLLWNGERWRRVASPDPGVWSEFVDVVSVDGATWAMGTFKPEGGAPHMLASKWTGSAWTVRTGPRGWAEAVDGLGRRALWAVGWSPSNRVTSKALIARWDGSSWSLARRLDRVEVLVDIEVAGPGSSWAVGNTWVRSEQSSRPFIVRRSDGRWRVDFAPDIHGRMTAIGGTPNNLWTFRADNPDLAEFAIFDSYHRC